MRKSLLLLPLTAALGGCYVGADAGPTAAGVAGFHQSLDAGAFEAIYADASPSFRNAASEADMVRRFSAIHRKLGPFVSAKPTGWKDDTDGGGHVVDVTLASQYARGAAQEDFAYRIDNGKAALTGYHINSAALLTK